ncbi:MAG: ArsR family transcriptional regulator [Methanoregula sp.]|jgi:flavodoxin
MMKVCIIYHSETGNTRHIAQHMSSVVDCHLVEVYDRAAYSALTRFLVRCKRARNEETVPIEPASIDVSGYDILVFGSPVWAFKPTPAIHAAIASVKGCGGKSAVAYCTHGGRPGDTEEILKKWIEARDMKFCGAVAIHQKDIENDKKNGELRKLIQAAKDSA